MKHSAALGRLCLLAAALIWGSSFVFMKQSVDAIDPYPLLGLRFTVGAVLLGVIFFRRVRAMKRSTLLHGIVIGALLCSAYITQTWGLSRTTPGKNAFLTAVYCVLVPFVNRLLFGRRTQARNKVAALLCLAGIGLVSLTSDLSIGAGDALTLVGGVFYALHMVAVSRFSEEDDAIVLTVLQFAAAAVICWCMTLAAGTMPAVWPRELLPELAYLSICATTVALLLQNIGQSRTPAAQASVLLSLESVFGVMFSVLLGQETLSPRITAGFIVIFAGVLIGETGFAPVKRFVSSRWNHIRND